MQRRGISGRHLSTLPPSHAQRNTIYALATPPGRGGIGVIRVSGPEARNVWNQTVRRAGQATVKTPYHRRMVRCQVVHPQTGDILDDGMAVFFQGGAPHFFPLTALNPTSHTAPQTYTSQDILELHIHSGRAVTSAILSALGKMEGLRPAEAGEFTRRACESGRIDLTEVEGIRDLVDAETETQRKIALKGAAVSVSC